MKFIKGLNKDAAPIDQPDGTYRYAKNITIDELAGAITNEVGTSVETQLITGSHVIGTIVLTTDDIVIFTASPNRSMIWLYSPASSNQAGVGTLTEVLRTNNGNTVTSNITGLENDVDLKFSIDYPIEGTYKIDPDQNVIVYWTDNFNFPRSLNITRQLTSPNTQWVYGVNPALSPNKNYIDRLNLFPHSGPVPKIEFNKINLGGGLKSGTYYLFLAYVDENFTQTNYCAYSLGVPIVEDIESVLPIERYDGCPADSQTGKSIVFDITNINTDYEFIRPVIVSRIDGVTNAFQLNDRDITGTSMSITHTGLEGVSSKSVDEIIIDTVSYDTAKTITQLDSVLYVGNLTGSKDIGYQKYANNIKLESEVVELQDFDTFEFNGDNLMFGYLNEDPLNVSKSNGYRDVRNISSSNNVKSYLRDEVYAFYIAFVLNDGSMSYAYHIPGRKALTGLDSDDILKIGASSSPALPATVDETDDVSDTELRDMTSLQGRLFHFYDFSTFANANDMNFWQNQNELYPQTDNYLVHDETGQIDDIRGENVRHHHFPSNANNDRQVITNSDDTYSSSTTTVTTTYYAAWGDANPNSGGDGEGHVTGTPNSGGIDYAEIDLGMATSGIMTNNNNNYNSNLSWVQGLVGHNSTWVYNATPPIGTSGFYMWTKSCDCMTINNNLSGIANAYIEDYQSGEVEIGQTSGIQNNGILNSGGGAVNYSIFIWTVTVPGISAGGTVTNDVAPLGFSLSQLKIPQSIANKVQGFRIYYAERNHANRRIIGQDIIKPTEEWDGADISGCENATGVGGALEDFLVATAIPRSEASSSAWTFHDFYLLNANKGKRKSLAPATHTTVEYAVEFYSFRGAGHSYPGVDGTDDTDCLYPDHSSSLHVSRDFNNISVSTTFNHYPLREKCKTYVNGDSIYDGRALGFGKRVWNLGGESHILLGYSINRRPSTPAFNSAWHVSGGTPSGSPFSDPGQSQTPVKLEIHNLHSFKTDMYNSLDAQELVWTGYEILGEDLENFIYDDPAGDGIGALTGGSTYATANIFGGDTFICRHGYRATHRKEGIGEIPIDTKSGYLSICESSDNINFRHEEGSESAYLPGSPAKKVLELEANTDLTSVDNVKYNKDYSLGVSDIKGVFPLPLKDEDPSIFKTRVQRSAKADNTSLIDNYRVFLALQFKDLPRNRGDLWKLITFNNLLYLHTEDSLFRTKGKQSLKLSDGSESFVGGGDIFQQEPDEMVQTKLGYGGTISQWASLVTKAGYFCLDYGNRRVFLVTDKMMDASKTGMESWFQDNIPFNFEANGMDPSHNDNPALGVGFHSQYDEEYDRILLTKRDLKIKEGSNLEQWIENFTDNITNQVQVVAYWDSNANSFVKRTPSMGGGFTVVNIPFRDPQTNILDTDNFELDGWTASFSPEFNVWVSFHDYIPYHYTRVKTLLGSFNEMDRSLYIHNDERNRGEFYGTTFSSEFEFIFNKSKNLDKVIYSFEYTIDVFNLGQTTRPLLHDPGFTSFYVYNTHQISDEREIEYMINTRRVGNEWKINKFRDLALLTDNTDDVYTGGVGGHAGGNFGITGANVAGTVTNSVSTTSFNSMFIVSGMSETINNAFIDATKRWDLQRKFTDKWVGIRLIYNNITKKLINLHSTDVAAKKFYR